MSRTARAVICRERNKPVVVEEVEVEGPRRNEVTVKMNACGVCHSDLSATNGTIRFPPPVILGHEGAGTVVEVGEGVTGLAVGDHVLTSFIAMCGKCRYCTSGRPVLCEGQSSYFTLPDGTVRTRGSGGEDINVFGGCGAMSEFATIHVDNLVRIGEDVPLDRAALVGCAVMTGVGAVFNTARLEPGSTAAVFGCGGVGLNVVQGCSIAGASRIVAVDTADNKLQLAREFGASDTINASSEDNVAKAVKKLTGGVDYAFECIGFGETVAQAYNSLGKGGTALVLGVPPADDRVTLKTVTLPMEERVLKGSYYGSARPQHDFPRILALYRGGRLKLDELVTRTYSVDQAPEAFADLEAGRNARGVIVFD
ncbi:MAG TPA: Zn-dependent alcohol dehydrogenase [Gammaproteobacteria bacterium]|nr:Zn-dependent alcohol dehydrogenase [Gammaproteobacteria bacterium]